jgi:hypothetical protein
MAGRQTSRVLFEEEWEYDTQEELDEALEQQERVCGDRRETEPGLARIYNWHFDTYRWTGRVKEE